MITIERLTKKYGTTLAVDDVSFTARAGPGDRLPRTERRREVHHPADHGRAHPTRRRAAPPSPGATTSTCPTPDSRSASCSTPPPSTPAAPAARSSPWPSSSWACPRSRVEEMLEIGQPDADRGVPSGR